MGQIILSQVGSAIGSAALPNGVNVFGAQVSGAAIGSTIGSFAGRAIDTALAPPIDGPRVHALHVMESREGAGVPSVYGRMRVGGQLIWASRFRERRREQSAGKGGPKIANYTYTVSIAVAIAEGPISRVDRVWANGEALRLADYNWRLYRGDDNQSADPLIEAVEGAGNVPAYRGLAYIVFEDLPLDRFGNRLPQLNFEVVRASQEDGGLRDIVRGVNIIPASGEFVYGQQIVRERHFPGIERALNMNNGAGDANFMRSLDQLRNDLPAATSAALTVGWFGNDLRAGECVIRPGVETRERHTVPYEWSVAGQDRSAARIVSQDGGAANYGGTPADRAVVEGIQAMKAQGIAVTLSPFLLMDVPAGNELPDPYGAAEQAAFPWRGRITVSTDGSPEAREDINAFLGTDHDYGFRHFILHHARLAVEAGGVDTLLIGSEMIGLTRVRDQLGAFPFVEGLIQLAADVREIVGAGTAVSYAADWTEYGAYAPGDGSGDVLFPLDPLWTSDDIDFVGVDWYPPAGDWRDGAEHLDALAGYQGADDPAYLESQMAGGEAYDWYYASPADRDAQVRTPIADTAHGEHWVFRQKDLAGWWASDHHARPGGVRNGSTTGWTGGLKPVRLMEIGFPAVDKGGNAPNLFYDPKSAESGLPPYSSGARNDVYQRRALEAALLWWQSQDFVERAFVWAWDARPWPDFPSRQDIWSDGPNWAYGHWLNGRTGLITMAEVAQHLGQRAGVALNAAGLPGLVEGMALDGPMSLRRALEPLNVLQPMACHEREGGLVLGPVPGKASISVGPDQLAEPLPVLTRPLLDKQPGRLSLGFVSPAGNYAPASVDARSDAGDPRYTVQASIPLVLSEAVAIELAQGMLDSFLEGETAEITLPPAFLTLEPGDMIEVAGLDGTWLIGDATDDRISRRLTLARPTGAMSLLAGTTPRAGSTAPGFAAAELVLIDGPTLPGAAGTGPMLAVSGNPWPGRVGILAGPDASSLAPRADVTMPARIGRLAAPLGAGVAGRWDRANGLIVEMHDADLSSATELAALAGENLALVQVADGWELVAFRTAELLSGNQWLLSDLLRGLKGSDPAGTPAGAIVVIVDRSLVFAEFQADETGLPLVWQAGDGEMQTFVHSDKAGLPWPIAHLKALSMPGGSVKLSWMPRGADIPDSWDRPDPLTARIYSVEAETSGEITHTELVTTASILVPDGVELVRVAEVGTDGRRGPWVSITLGAS